MQASQSIRSLWFGVALVGLAVFTSGRAKASEVFPGALQEAANMECVPMCTMCHTSNPGTATSWANESRTLPIALKGTGILKAGDAASLKAAYAQWATTQTPAVLAQIKSGHEPKTNEDVCAPSYGCGAHIAKQATMPSDYSGALWALGAVVAGGLLRRRRRP